MEEQQLGGWAEAQPFARYQSLVSQESPMTEGRFSEVGNASVCGSECGNGDVTELGMQRHTHTPGLCLLSV